MISLVLGLPGQASIENIDLQSSVAPGAQVSQEGLPCHLVVKEGTAPTALYRVF